MKKLLYLFSCVALSGFLFTACEEDPTEDLSPSLKIESGSDYIADGDTIEPGDDIYISVIAKANTSSTSPIVEVKISAIFNNVAYDSISETIDVDKKDTYAEEFDFVAPEDEGTGIITIKATDKDGETSTVTISFTVKAPAEGSLKAEITGVKIYCTLGDGTGKSTCASVDGTTYAPKTASSTEQGKVDFVYFYTSSAGIYAPSAVPGALNTAFSSWTTSNATVMGKVTADYANVTLDDVIDLAGSVSGNSVTGLAVNDVVAFETADNKVGVFKVTEIKAGYNATDYIVISIKVEE